LGKSSQNLSGLPELTSKHLLIVFHSQSGRAESLALAVYKGALRERDVKVRLRRAMDAQSADILWADALLMVSPENFGAAAGGIKDFLDRVYYPMERTGKQGLPYALIISAGNDGTGCERQLERILKGMAAKKIQDSCIIHGQPLALDLNNAGDTGEAIATGLVLGIF
jgi:NAD(P)H-dependent FMN reductase